MNIAGMIKRLRGRQYDVTRVIADGAYDQSNGVFQAGAADVFPVLGSLQPAGPEDLLSIPEGDRTKEAFRFYSVHALKNNRTEKLRLGDTLDVEGVGYRVQNVEHWPQGSKSIVVRVNTDAN